LLWIQWHDSKTYTRNRRTLLMKTRNSSNYFSALPFVDGL
jgi:hypothetical protein